MFSLNSLLMYSFREALSALFPIKDTDSRPLYQSYSEIFLDQGKDGPGKVLDMAIVVRAKVNSRTGTGQTTG